MGGNSSSNANGGNESRQSGLGMGNTQAEMQGLASGQSFSEVASGLGGGDHQQTVHTYNPSTGDWDTSIEGPSEARGYTQQKDGSWLSPDKQEVVNEKGETIGRQTGFGGYMTTVAGYDWTQTPGVTGWDISAISDPSNPNYNAYRSALQASAKDRYEAASQARLQQHYEHAYRNYGLDVTPADREAFMAAAGRAAYRNVNADIAQGIDPNMNDIEIAAAYSPEGVTQGLTDTVNAAISDERGLLGGLFDTITGREHEVDPTGYSRALTPSGVEELSKKGTLGAAVSGLSQGVLQTNEKGEVVDDRWGQFADVADSALMTAALPIGSLFVGGLFGDALGDAGTAAAGEALGGGMPGFGTAASAAGQDLAGMGKSLLGAAEPLVDAYDIAQLRERVGLERQTPATTGGIGADADGDQPIQLVESPAAQESEGSQGEGVTYTSPSRLQQLASNTSQTTSSGSYGVSPINYNPYMYSSYMSTLFS